MCINVPPPPQTWPNRPGNKGGFRSSPPSRCLTINHPLRGRGDSSITCPHHTQTRPNLPGNQGGFRSTRAFRTGSVYTRFAALPIQSPVFVALHGCRTTDFRAQRGLAGSTQVWAIPCAHALLPVIVYVCTDHKLPKSEPEVTYRTTSMHPLFSTSIPVNPPFSISPTDNPREIFAQSMNRRFATPQLMPRWQWGQVDLVSHSICLYPMNISWGLSPFSPTLR